MTSKNSFFNLLKEDLHRRLWTLILSSLVFFATFIIAFTMILQNYVSRYDGGNFGYTQEQMIERISQNLCQDFYGFYPWFALVAVVGAIICAMNGFAYLHSRKQMDFYHSLPVKREKLFAVRFVNGIMIYALPYLAGLLYSYVLCAIYGVMTWDIFFSSLFFFVLHLMSFLIMYLGTILAMMLTGKMVIAFFGTCVINLYAPAVYALFIYLKEIFFVTSYSNYTDLMDALQITRWLSPGGYILSLFYKMESGEGTFWLEFLAFLVVAAALTALNLWLYKKRASEKADTAMSFKITEPVIRIMISVPVGILVGLMFYFIQYDFGGGASIFWLIFGGLLGGFVCHGVIEALYNGDIKKCLSHKWQMLATMILAAVVPLAFLYDVFGYDSYLPKKSAIANMAISSSELRFGGSYYDEEGWISPEDYALENMEVTDIDAMYELAEILSEEAGQNRGDRFFGYNRGWASDIYYAGGAEKSYYTEFTIRYRLRNGSEVTRQYEYNYYAVQDILERIYNNDQYKRAAHPVFSLIENGLKPKSLECYTPVTGVYVMLDKNVETIMNTYAEEIRAMSFDDLKNTAPIGELTANFTLTKDIAYTGSSTFLVYPSMTRTLALLKDSGYNMQGIQETDTDITSITVRYSGSINDLKRSLGMEVSETAETYEAYEDTAVYGEYEIYYEKTGAYPAATEEYYREVAIEFTDAAEIAEIKKHLAYVDYFAEFGPYPEREGLFVAEVFMEATAGPAYVNGLLNWSERFRFMDGKVPQFVIDRVFEELGEN